MALSLAYGVVLLGVLAGSCMAVDYTVGDSNGWEAPSSTSFYSDWAAGKTFNVGDVLVFNFSTGAHDVATVTKTAYDSCDLTTTETTETTGPAKITLTAGEHYYFCTYTGHCTQGQKLAVNVTTGSTTPSPPPPAATTPSPPPPAATTPSPPPPATTPSPPPPPGSTTPSSPPPSGSTTPTAATPASSPGSSPPPPPSSAATATSSSAVAAVITSVVFGLYLY